MASWQDITALAVVSFAAGYLALRGWRLLFARPGGQGCSSCGGCSGGAAAGAVLVSLELPLPTQASARQPSAL